MSREKNGEEEQEEEEVGRKNKQLIIRLSLVLRFYQFYLLCFRKIIVFE